jgi:hypothetical protein
MRHTILALGLLAGAASPAWGKTLPRSFLFAYPITVGSPISLLYNYDQKVAISLDVTGEAPRERLTPLELKDTPNDSLLTASQEVGLALSRYSNPENMSGWYWSLGAGYKKMNAQWKIQPKDELTRRVHLVSAMGATGTGRGGYRYVAEELGFAASLFMIVKHFQIDPKLKNLEGKSTKYQYSPISEADNKRFRKKLTTSVYPGIEIGWAF